MAEHPSFTLAGLLGVGGTAAFIRTGSRPSLIAGLGLGATYGLAGYLIKQNKDYGTELALGSSVLLLAAGGMRARATRFKSPVPLGLAATGGLATFYYQRKVREFRFGV